MGRIWLDGKNGLQQDAHVAMPSKRIRSISSIVPWEGPLPNGWRL